MRGRDMGAALALLAFGVGYGSLTSGLPQRTLPDTPGPSFFPWLLTASLLFLSGALLIQGLRGSPGGARPLSLGPGGRVRATAGLLLLAAYLAALPYLGFLLATPLLFAGLMGAAGERRPLHLAGFSLALPLLLFFLFDTLFLIPLPR